MIDKKVLRLVPFLPGLDEGAYMRVLFVGSLFPINQQDSKVTQMLLPLPDRQSCRQ